MASAPAVSVSPRRASIRAYLLGLVLAVALPLTAVEAWNLHATARDDSRSARGQVLHLAQITASETAKFLGQAQNILNGLAARPAVRALDPARCDPILKDFLGLAPRFSNVVTVTIDGEVICSAIPLASPTRVDPGVLLNRMRETRKLTVGKATPGAITGRWAVPVALPLLDAQGGITGAVGLSLDLLRFPVLPSVDGLPADSVFGLIAGDGTVLAHSLEPTKFVGTNQAHHAIARLVLRDRQGTAEENGIDGIARVQGFAPVPGTDWIAIASRPAREVYASVTTRVQTSSLMGVAALLCALMLAARWSREIRGPISLLASTAEEVAAGNLSARAQVSGAAEIAEVGVQFNRMLEARLRADTALKESERSYATLVKNIAGAVYRCRNDPDWTVEFISDGCFEVTGYRPDELLGNRMISLGALMHPEDAQTVWNKCQANLAAHKLCSNEYRIIHRSGEQRWVLDQAQGIYSGAGELLKIEGLICDITERKQADEKIAEQVRELRLWYEATLGREDRVRSLKEEVNELRARLGETPRYLEPKDGTA